MSSALGAGPLGTNPPGPGPLGAGTGLEALAPDGVGVPAGTGAGVLFPPAGKPGKNRMLQLPRSRKIRVGLGLALVFTVLAAIGPWIAPFDPGKSLSTTSGVPQPPSGAHWLGTTQVQQDVLSQLLAGGRSTILVALIAGAVATMLAVGFGVTAGYTAGCSTICCPCSPTSSL